MAKLRLTFEPPAEATTMLLPDDPAQLHKTPSGPKLGADLVVGDGIDFGGFWVKIATITQEA